MKLRFSIRDLLWLPVVVALAVGWWFDRNGLVNQRDDYVRRFERAESDLKFLRAHSEQMGQAIDDLRRALRTEKEKHSSSK